MGTVRLNVPILQTNRYAFISYSLRKDLGFNPGNCSTIPPSPSEKFFIKNSNLAQDRTRYRCVHSFDLSASKALSQNFRITEIFNLCWYLRRDGLISRLFVIDETVWCGYLIFCYFVRNERQTVSQWIVKWRIVCRDNGWSGTREVKWRWRPTRLAMRPAPRSGTCLTTQTQN